MGNRPKGYACRQPDQYRVPAKPKARLPHRGEPDGGDGGDTEGLGALIWGIAICAAGLLILRFIF